jgi:TRAP-type C4-dicarboxylate transport system substrate-binding protein
LVLAIALLSLVALASGLEAAPKVIQLAGMNPVDYPATKQMFVLKDIFDKGTEGRYEIRVFPGNQLGDYTQVYEEVMRGSIDMALITVPSQFDKRLELIFFPYICNSYDNISQYFSQGQFLYSTMERVHAALGVKLLGFSVEGLSGIGSTKPAQSPGDPAVGKGVLLRMAPIDAIKFGGMALGFQTMSLPYAEVYTALQTGIIDAYEVGPATLAYMNYKDLTKQYYQYNNYMECNQWIINKNLFDSMSPEDQKLLLENIAKFQEESIAQAKANETEYADEMKKAGIEVVSFTPEELDLLAKHVRQEAWPKLRDQITPEIYDELIKIYQEK